MSNNLLPAYLKEQLKQRKWSGRTLAMYAGVSHSTVARAVRGTHVPDPENIRKIAMALEIAETHLLRLAGHVTTPPTSDLDPAASYIAQRLSGLPKGVREGAIQTIGAVVDNIYAITEYNQSSDAKNESQEEQKGE